jgi:hypothetical protein
MGLHAGLEEADRRLLTDELGDALVECRLLWQEGRRVDQLVQDRLDQAHRTLPEHGRGHRIVQPAESGVGRDARLADVEGPGSQALRLASGVLVIEVALVGQPAQHGKPEGHRLERARPGADEGRDQAILLRPVDIAGVLVPDAQPQLASEVPNRSDQAEQVSDVRRPRRIGEHLLDRLPRPEQRQLAPGELAVVTTAGAECGHHEQADEESAIHGR